MKSKTSPTKINLSLFTVQFVRILVNPSCDDSHYWVSGTSDTRLVLPYKRFSTRHITWTNNINKLIISFHPMIWLGFAEFWQTIFRCSICVSKGVFTNYVEKILAFFDHLSACVDIFYGMNVDKKWTFEITYLPRLVNIVCEQPLAK